jgi:hypothetical protein
MPRSTIAIRDSNITAGEETTCVSVDGTLRAVILSLWQASQLAVDAECDIWDFAVELDELRTLGANVSELRWLLARGIATQAGELPPGVHGRRRFAAPSRWMVMPNSCFVLTESGLNWARQLAERIDPARIRLPSVSSTANGNPSRPFYNDVRNELVFGDEVVKRFRTPAFNQQAVLAAFQILAWPDRIHDPLPPSGELCPRRRLSETIRALNRRQMRTIVRFSGDGSGLGVLWERVG